MGTVERIPGRVNTNRHRKYNRRQRKKHRIGEFQELDCELSIRFEKGFDEARADQSIADLNEQLLMLGDLCFAGTCVDLPNCVVYVAAVARYDSLSEEACNKINEWAKDYSGVVESTSRQLDMHYDVDAVI
jgi:uncharacterized protein YggL (DUF469 family)